MDLRFEASGVDAPEGEVVGFAVRGPFSFDEAGGLPVAKLEYTHLAGTEALTSTLVSTGEAAFVEMDGVAYELPDDAAAALLLPGDDGASPVSGLRLASWIADPEEVEEEQDGATVHRTSGPADLAVVLADLFAASSGFTAEPLAVEGDIEDDDAAVLERAVRSSSVEVVSDADDHDLRSLVVDIELGSDLGDEDLGAALERFAGARIHFTLTLTDHGAELDIDPPPDPRPASELPGEG